MSDLKRTVLRLNSERNRYEAALHKIAGWEGRATGATHMLKMLQKIAEEALS